MRFLNIKLENWRNFREVDLNLRRRAFLAGPNAAGKSNLLDAFRFLADIAREGGGLQWAVNKRQGLSKIRCLAARRYPDVAFEVEIGDEADTPEWSYRIDLNQDNQRRARLRSEVVRHRGAEVLRRPDSEDDTDTERLTQTHLEQVTANKNFRDIADFFNSVRYLHIVPQLVREPDRSVGRKADPFGGDFLERIATTPHKTRESRLGRIRKALEVAVPQLKDLKLERDARGTPHLNGLYEHWRPNAGWQGEDQFSDGTLRLLGLLWAVLDGSGPLLLEEPELSLHPEVVRHIPQMLSRISRKSGRQILVSTHSSSMLEDSGLAPEEVVLLRPASDGTEVFLASDDEQVLALLDGGETMAGAVIPKTSPKGADQLPLFGDLR